MKFFASLLFVGCLAAPAAFAAAPVDGYPGEKCFEQIAGLQQNYDPKAADFISNNATISLAVLFPDGTSKSRIVPAPEYKKKLAEDLAGEKAKGITHTYASLQAKPLKGGLFTVTGSDTSSADNITADFTNTYKIDKKAQCSISEIAIVIHAAANPPKADK